MKLPQTTDKKNNSQSGLASILVTLIIMIVISLIVLAAAQLARRGQRQTLDRQLSTQAFYAAESGINDVVRAIERQLLTTNPGDPAPLADNDHTNVCNGPGSFIQAADPDLVSVLDATNRIEYSCLLVDPTPTTWEGNVNDSSRTTPIQHKSNGPINTITIAWQAKDGIDVFTGCDDKLAPETGPTARSCKTPILRFDLVSTLNKTRTGLNDNVMTGFLIPSDAAAASTLLGFSVSSTPANQTATKTPVKCSKDTTPKYCKVTITGLGGTEYYLRMKSIYGTASVTVSAEDGFNNKYELKNSQIVIDSTGKANDILRRIQVRVPFTGVVDTPEFAIQTSDSICKRLVVGALTTDPECGL